jgi:hypothetical protein
VAALQLNQRPPNRQLWKKNLPNPQKHLLKKPLKSQVKLKVPPLPLRVVEY